MENKYTCLKNFYSLGPHCCPRMRLDWFKNKNNIEINETNFFDYLMVDINSIISIFKEENINNILNIKNFNIYHVNNDNIFIECKNFFFRSIHDIPNNDKLISNDLDINSIELDFNIHFIEKYTRRYNRLLNLLKNNDNILFLYQSYIPYEEYLKLENIFKKYTKKIIIISLSDFGENTNEIRKIDNLYYLNYFNMYKTKDYIYEASMEFLDWDLIFEKIVNIYHENFTEQN